MGKVVDTLRAAVAGQSRKEPLFGSQRKRTGSDERGQCASVQVLDYEKTDGVAERVRGGRKGGKVDKHNIPSASPLSFSLAPRVFNGFIP